MFVFSVKHAVLTGASLLLSATAAGLLHLHASGHWKNKVFKTNTDASQAARVWIDQGGFYTVKLRRSQQLALPQDKAVVNDQTQNILEIQASERDKCLKMLETIKNTIEYESCIKKFYSVSTNNNASKAAHKKVDIIIREERLRRACRPLASNVRGYVCGEHDIEEGAVINEQEERGLRANLKLTYFYVQDLDS